MDTVIWVLIIVLVVAAAAGGGVLLARNGALASGPFASWRESTRPGERGVSTTSRAVDAVTLEPRQLSPAEVIDLPVLSRPERRRAPETTLTEPHGSTQAARAFAEPGDSRSERDAFDPGLAAGSAPGANRLESRMDDLERELLRRMQGIQDAVTVSAGETRAELSLNRDGQTTAFERFRDAMTAELAHEPVVNGLLERRMDAAADLYARVARFELAIAQATNPVLLPGEPYTPPGDFPVEALAWESWKDAGERAFALAEGYSIQRIYLTEPARSSLAAFITLLRGLLTRSIYPNLGPHPNSTETHELRAALLNLATELPKVRRVLEAELDTASAETN